VGMQVPNSSMLMPQFDIDRTSSLLLRTVLEILYQNMKTTHKCYGKHIR
jgi:hypothetical protein